MTQAVAGTDFKVDDVFLIPNLVLAVAAGGADDDPIDGVGGEQDGCGGRVEIVTRSRRVGGAGELRQPRAGPNGTRVGIERDEEASIRGGRQTHAQGGRAKQVIAAVSDKALGIPGGVTRTGGVIGGGEVAEEDDFRRLGGDFDEVVVGIPVVLPEDLQVMRAAGNTGQDELMFAQHRVAGTQGATEELSVEPDEKAVIHTETNPGIYVAHAGSINAINNGGLRANGPGARNRHGVGGPVRRSESGRKGEPVAQH